MSEHGSIPDVITDASGERLADAAAIGAGVPVLAFDVGGTDIIRRCSTPTAELWGFAARRPRRAAKTARAG